jgi:anti-sigma factor RsiW
MICINKNKQGAEILLAYGAGTLDAEQSAAWEAHAAQCGECRAVMAAQKHLWDVLDHVEAPEISADFDARLYARIAREEAQPAWKSVWRTLLGLAPAGVSWKPVAAGAAAAAVLAVGLLVHVPKAQNPSSQIRPESMDAEQVEVTIEDLEMLMPPAASAGRM